MHPSFKITQHSAAQRLQSASFLRPRPSFQVDLADRICARCAGAALARPLGQAGSCMGRQPPAPGRRGSSLLALALGLLLLAARAGRGGRLGLGASGSACSRRARARRATRTLGTQHAQLQGVELWNLLVLVQWKLQQALLLNKPTMPPRLSCMHIFNNACHRTAMHPPARPPARPPAAPTCPLCPRLVKLLDVGDGLGADAGHGGLGAVDLREGGNIYSTFTPAGGGVLVRWGMFLCAHERIACVACLPWQWRWP